MENITAAELKERMDKGEKLNIIDVREEWEHDEFNIGGKLIPLGSLPQQLDQINNLKDEELILYCRSGNRSGKATQFLMSNGFTKARNLTGGMLEWQKSFPT